MGLVVSPGVLRWRVILPASREQVFDVLMTDAGRCRFWAESSNQRGDRVDLRFADGTGTVLEVRSVLRPATIEVRYFGTPTTFALQALTPASTLLEVTADDVDPADQIEVAAGWVSVLLCLKAYLMAGIDLRNHAAPHSWRHGFVDN